MGAGPLPAVFCRRPAVVYTLFATPIYSADALVQIEQNTGNSLVQDIGSALANKPPASDAEIQLIQSRLVLGKTFTTLGSISPSPPKIPSQSLVRAGIG